MAACVQLHTCGRGTPRLGMLMQDSRRWEELFRKGKTNPECCETNL